MKDLFVRQRPDENADDFLDATHSEIILTIVNGVIPRLAVGITAALTAVEHENDMDEFGNELHTFYLDGQHISKVIATLHDSHKEHEFGKCVVTILCTDGTMLTLDNNSDDTASTITQTRYVSDDGKLFRITRFMEMGTDSFRHISSAESEIDELPPDAKLVSRSYELVDKSYSHRELRSVAMQINYTCNYFDHLRYLIGEGAQQGNGNKMELSSLPFRTRLRILWQTAAGLFPLRRSDEEKVD